MAIKLSNLPTLWNGNHDRTQAEIQSFSPAEIASQVRWCSAPSIHSIIKSYGPFPPYSLVVGICQDGLPFMIGLDNPKSGSLLVVSDNSIEKTQLLRTLILSACMINNSDQISLSIITNKNDHYSDIMKYPNCQAIIDPYNKEAGEMVIEYASIVEQRRTGRELGGAMLLFIDDNESFHPMLSDYSVYLNLKTLVTMGPKSGIWPIITINPAAIHSSKGQLLRSFGTYIFQKVSNDPMLLPSPNPTNHPELVYQPIYNVIIGGRLIPISNLSV